MHVLSTSTIYFAFALLLLQLLPTQPFQLNPSTISTLHHPVYFNIEQQFKTGKSTLFSKMNNRNDSQEGEADSLTDRMRNMKIQNKNDGWEPAPTRKRRPRKSQSQNSAKVSNFSVPSKNSTITLNNQTDPFVILLVGLPGSGKSTFAKTLQQLAPSKYVRINQDTLGNRKKCESLMRKTLREKKCPIIDRCNFNQQQRDYFWKIAMEERLTNIHQKEEVIKVQGVECIVFTCSAKVCVDRCEGRGDTHETIKPGMARMVVKRMKNDLVLPDSKERKWKNLRFVKNNSIDDMKKLIKYYL